MKNLPNLKPLADTTRGFHGTRQNEADEIIRTNFKPSARNAGAYLGEGVYFFDNQLGHAKDWAENRAGNRMRGTAVAVIQSEVRYGKLLNLTDDEHLQTVRWFKTEFERNGRTRTTLAAIIDIVADKTGAEVVKACRIRGNSLQMEHGFSADVEIILAVRALGNILSKQVVLSWMIGYK